MVINVIKRPTPIGDGVKITRLPHVEEVVLEEADKIFKKIGGQSIFPAIFLA